jgi:hypothetical protein
MDERYEIKISGDHASVRLTDAQTGAIHIFTGRRALFDALGVLAMHRDRDLAQGVGPDVIADALREMRF